MARLAGVDIPKHEDTEETIADLKARIAKSVAFLKSVPAEKIDGTEDKEIVIKRPDRETRYTGMQFLMGHAMPNFYFHVTTLQPPAPQRRRDRQAGLPRQSLKAAAAARQLMLQRPGDRTRRGRIGNRSGS